MRSDTTLRRWKLVTEARMLSTESGQIVEAGNDLAEALAAANARIEAVEAERDELHRLVWRTKDALIAAIAGEADSDE